ncbi:hypothetical protein EVAR_86875_1 [Eumeta japonica]|uniref:Uncharacterized protein n=1 Tax=Eumeta variegata TaxID=151549 RepID=A0A4C1ZJG1_EUMVA|nr:hypothetical protein EVAR_86875_1 [Eumeta japonica]
MKCVSFVNDGHFRLGGKSVAKSVATERDQTDKRPVNENVLKLSQQPYPARSLDTATLLTQTAHVQMLFARIETVYAADLSSLDARLHTEPSAGPRCRLRTTPLPRLRPHRNRTCLISNLVPDFNSGAGAVSDIYPGHDFDYNSRLTFGFNSVPV